MSNRELSPAVEVMSEPREPEYLRLLKAGKARIADPADWIQGFYYLPVYSTNLKPAYCMLGTLGWDDAVPDIPGAVGDDASWMLQRVIGGDDSIPDFNDDPSTTHADVMAAFDLAIEQATKDWLVAK